MFYLVLLLLLLIFIVALFFSFKLCKKVVYPKTRCYEDSIKLQIDDLGLRDFYDSLPKEEFFIDSTLGYKLKGIFINNNNSKKCIIICHGIACNLNHSIKYIHSFYKRGFSVVIYDHRNHGLSGGNFTSMGYFEKFDLKTFADWVFERIGFDTTLGVLGESMGAGTVIQYCDIDDRVNFCIEDCGYSNVKDLFAFRLKEDYNLPIPQLVSLSNIIIKLKFKWSFQEASPIKYIKDISIPVLFIHGGKDTYVPTYMVHELYEAKVNGFKDIYICEDGLHANSYQTDPIKYDAVIEKFLNNLNL